MGTYEKRPHTSTTTQTHDGTTFRKPGESTPRVSGVSIYRTWYWNRYPGIACDVESYAYMPLLEETGYGRVWDAGYIHGCFLEKNADASPLL